MEKSHELVRRVIDGDKEAYNELVESVYPMVYGRYSLVLKLYPSQVDDGVQEFFLKLPELLKRKFDFTSKASTFIYTSCAYYALNFKKVSIFKTQRLTCPIQSMGISRSRIKGVNDLDLDRMWDRIFACVNKMSGELSEVFYMNYEGYTHKEIAEHLDIKEKTSAKRLFDANKILRKELKDDFLELF